MTYADKLRQARKLLKLSQHEPGDMTGASRQSLIAWENAGAVPRAGTMKMLAKAPQAPVDYPEHDELTNPLHEAERKDNAHEGRERYGNIIRKAKNALFEATMRDCLACKVKAGREARL